MNATTTALPRKSASAKGLPSWEVNVNCGAGPITGNSRLPSPPYAGSDARKASSADTTRNAANIPAFSLSAGEFVGKNRIGTNFIRDNTHLNQRLITRRGLFLRRLGRGILENF